MALPGNRHVFTSCILDWRSSSLPPSYFWCGKEELDKTERALKLGSFNVSPLPLRGLKSTLKVWLSVVSECPCVTGEVSIIISRAAEAEKLIDFS